MLTACSGHCRHHHLVPGMHAAVITDMHRSQESFRGGYLCSVATSRTVVAGAEHKLRVGPCIAGLAVMGPEPGV